MVEFDGLHEIVIMSNGNINLLLFWVPGGEIVYILYFVYNLDLYIG